MLLATHNRDKVAEITAALRGLPLRLVAASEWGDLPQVEEDQDTLQGNAIKKARVLAELTGLAALADDTGLEVSALGGAPGVHSSRYAGEKATYDDNVRKLLQEMQTVPDIRRQARFRCVIAVAMGEEVKIVEGECRGIILGERRGQGGFGYDPVFLVPELNKTFAELTLAEKNRISHRGQALRKAREMLCELFAIKV